MSGNYRCSGLETFNDDMCIALGNGGKVRDVVETAVPSGINRYGSVPRSLLRGGSFDGRMSSGFTAAFLSREAISAGG